jgi:transposase-like protein
MLAGKEGRPRKRAATLGKMMQNETMANGGPVSSRLLDEEEACGLLYEWLWPHGMACPHCFTKGDIGRLRGPATRIGTFKCYTCRKPFSIKSLTVFGGSHLPIHVWLQAIYMMTSTNGMCSSTQLQEVLGSTNKTAAMVRQTVLNLLQITGIPTSKPIGTHRND